MATLTANNLTLADIAKRTDPNGASPVIAELLSQSNEMLTDMVWKEGNLPTGERLTKRTSLPGVSWRALNAGVATTKSTTAQVDEACGILEAYSELDIDVAKLNGNTAAHRLSEDQAFIEAMNQEMQSTALYGNPAVDPKKPMGFMPRYSVVSAANPNVIDAGGASGATNTSILLVGWGPQTVYGIFPKGSKAGLEVENLGPRLIQSASSATPTSASSTDRMMAYVTRFQWKAGLAVKDDRYVVRIGSVEVADAAALTNEMAPTATTNIIHQMAKALARIPMLGMCRPAFYMNRTIFTALMRTALEKSNAAVTVQSALSQFGTHQSWLSFLGVPIRRVDAILNTETDV